jgi:hypothetical protein
MTSHGKCLEYSGFLFVCFETGSCYVAQVALNLQLSCLSLPSAGIIGGHLQVELLCFIISIIFIVTISISKIADPK